MKMSFGVMCCSSSKRATTTETEGEVPGVDSFGAETQELLSSQNLEADRPRSKGASQSYPSLASGEVSLGGAEGTSPGISPSATTELSPIELLGPAANVEELQRRISESFSRKLTEWERRKFRRPTTPEMEQKNRSRKEKEEKSRSKKSREEKERDRLEKAREREMQKVEREQVKLEKEKVRIEKERQRAMEKQAKLERMKGRLSQADSEPPSSPGSPTPSSPTPAQDALAQYKVTADFKKKLHEWEQMKGPLAIPESGLSSDAGTPSPQPTTAPPSFSLGPTHDGTQQGQEGDRRKDSRPPPLTLHPCLPESPEDRSPVEKTSDISYGDDNTSVTDESLTKSNIASLERANAQLLKEVQRKEHEYATLQEEVSKLNSKLDKVRQEHAAEMARFKRELESGVMTTPVQLEVGELESTVRELEEKIVLMEDAGDQLAESMESAAIGKWQSMESEEVVSQELVDMVDQMKGMLVQVAHSSESSPKEPSAPTSLPPPPPPSAPPLTSQRSTEEQTQKTTAMHNFENVYSHAMKLQVQMNNLRVSQLERNKEIMLIKRQLLLQEVNNVLLQAHITRRETELYQYREAKRHGTLRRWNTFSGQGDGQVRPPLLRNISMQDRDPPVQPFPPPSSSKAKHSAKHDDIHHVTDENASISTPRVVAAGGQAGGPVAGGQIPPSASCPIITMTAPTPEKSTDHREQYLTSPAASTTSTSTSNGTAAVAEQRRPGEQQGDRTPAPVLTGAATPAPASSRPATSGTQMTSAPTSTTTTTTSAAAAATSGASKVETGSPTLLAQTSASSASATSPVTARHVQPADTETPAKPIPERQDAAGVGGASPSSPAKSASQADDNYSQTRAVMECTQSTDLDPQASGPPGGGGRGGGPPSPPSPSGPAGGVDIGHQPPPKTVRSPVSRQKYLRRQQEEREKKKERLASPKTAHKGDSGKPPPHPHTSPSTAPRSKSVGDMEGTEPDSSAHAAAPLREVIQKFEKRATVCETEERKIEFRKTPSPTLHLPRVGLVSRVRRLKPAAELLQESQRYRSGHSIYATRIMNRYLPARSPQPGVSPTQDKENVSDRTYVQAMVKKLSREGTPVKSPGSSSASSSLSLHRTDSPGSPGRSGRSELVSQLVHKLSSHSGSVDSPASSRKHPHPPSSSSLPAPSPSSPSSPLKDVTNEGQGKKLARSFSLEGEGRGQGPCDQHTLSASDLAASDRTKASQPAESVPGAPVSSTSEKPDSTISPGSLSMPALAFHPGEDPGDEAEARERAATYCVSEGERLRQQQQLRAQDSGGGESIEQIAEEFLDPTLLSIRASKGQKISPSSSTKSKNTLCCKSSACSKAKNSSSASSSSQSSGALKLPSSPKSQERKGIKEKMETIGVLCKQSMSFDLGVSRRTQPQEAMSRRPQSAESLTPSPGGGAEGGASDKPRPASTSSEGDAAAAAAAAAASATAASSDDKKKSSRSRFLDSSWLQKPKKFFKVSKYNQLKASGMVGMAPTQGKALPRPNPLRVLAARVTGAAPPSDQGRQLALRREGRRSYTVGESRKTLTSDSCDL